MPESTSSISATPTIDDLGQLESGLDNLETGSRPRPSLKSSILKLLSPLIAIVAVIVIWQVIIYLQWQPEWIIPSPKAVLDSLGAQAEQEILWQATFGSIKRAAQGFVIALAVAIPIGLALGLNKYLRAIFGPLLTGLQQLPSVAWVPAAIIWFGLSDATIYTVILLGAVPSIANGLISGMDQIPTLYLRAGQVLGATGGRRFATSCFRRRGPVSLLVWSKAGPSPGDL